MKRLVLLLLIAASLIVPLHAVQAAKSVKDVKSEYNAKARVDCATQYGKGTQAQEELAKDCQQKVFNQLEKLCKTQLDTDNAKKIEDCFKDKYDEAKDKTTIFTTPASTGSNPGGNVGNLGSASTLGIPDLSFDGLAANIIQALGLIAGAIAAIYLVLGGIKYSASNGDPTGIANAKRTITYAIAGLVISILATTIVAFVAGRAPQ